MDLIGKGNTALQTAPFSNDTLADFYRFALLLTGTLKTAEQIMADTLQAVQEQLGELRHESSRRAWLAMRIRERCLRENAINPNAIPRLLRDDDDRERGEVLKIEAFIVAQRFSTLHEPERSALALFYLEIFSLEEIAKLLKIDTEELAAALGRGRTLLDEAIHPKV
jgi:DNA-directed RNA polymerase specialized sigma24 family protein